MPKDKLGVEITVGAFIAYGHALGRCAGLRLGKVLAIGERDDWGKKQLTITVMGVDDDWKHRPPELCKRNGTLLYPNRILVLSREQMPATHLALLDIVEVVATL